jgi:hypothetical protein
MGIKRISGPSLRRQALEVPAGSSLVSAILSSCVDPIRWRFLRAPGQDDSDWRPDREKLIRADNYRIARVGCNARIVGYCERQNRPAAQVGAGINRPRLLVPV